VAPRIGLIGNHWTALLAARVLRADGVLAGVATPRRDHDANRRLRAFAEARDLPLAWVEPDEQHGLAIWLAETRSDAVFVVGCPHRLEPEVVAGPRHGFLNFHFGMLPGYRGPDPVFWQIRRGETVGGITVHRMDAAFDHGPMVACRQVAIGAADIYGVHVNKLARVLGGLVHELAGDLDGAAPETQDHAVAAYQRRPRPSDLVVDWARDDAAAVAALARAANPLYGGAVTFLRSVPVRVLEATPAEARSDAEPGTWHDDVVACAGATSLRLDVVATDDGVMSARRFACAFDVRAGERFATPTEAR
jgi:methionyl-tRNA formyltransferase